MKGTNLKQLRICIIGAGAMGGSVALGLLDKGVVEPWNLTVADPDLNKLKIFEERGARIFSDNREAVKDADVVIIAVKPWIVKEVVGELLPDLSANTEAGVIAASVSGEELKEMFSSDTPGRLSIVMPNTAIRIGQSMTFIVPVNGHPEIMTELFGFLGSVKVIPERQLSAATALASCGIAYAMRYIRAATEGGVELGIPAEEAKEIVCQTIKGAADLLLSSGNNPEAEIDKVTTPGGLTIRGLNAMEREGFTNAVISGLKAGV